MVGGLAALRDCRPSMAGLDDVLGHIHARIPRTIRSDSGPRFTSASCKDLYRGVGVEIKLSPVEIHNSLGHNERLRSPLRRCFLKIKNDIPSLADEVALRVIVKAINDTVGPNGLIPTLLVFGNMPQLPLMQGNLIPYSGQEQRESALRAATAEYQKYVCERRLREALFSKISPAMNCV
jgi:transposase InsO family protein